MIFSVIIQIFVIFYGIFGGIMSLSIILSWIPGVYEIAFFRQIRNISDWYLGTFRGRLIVGIIDFGPLVGLAIYSFILNLLYIWI
ncbi:MAG TPA: hypothetical protein GYA05_02660 [Acholeplasmataceae bacterium]|jgi:hypothetical protein|nr:hypothetical protein [Acholeplasmataceae bacterium]